MRLSVTHMSAYTWFVWVVRRIQKSHCHKVIASSLILQKSCTLNNHRICTNMFALLTPLLAGGNVSNTHDVASLFSFYKY